MGNRSLKCVCICLGMLVSLWIISVSTVHAQSFGWTTKANMPTMRYGLGVAAASNGKLYAIGGLGTSGFPVTVVEEYDPATNVWSTRASMPTARFGLGVVTAGNGKIYAVGGQGYLYAILSTVEEYDPATNVWTTKASMPTARRDLGVVSPGNGKIYAIGGTDQSGSGNILATVEEYHPETNVWTTKANMPTARYGLGVAATRNGKIYAIGGISAHNTVEEFDPTTNSWVKKTRMPESRAQFGVAVANNDKIFVFGGDGLDTVAEFDPSASIWTMKTPMPTKRYAFAVAPASNGKIYVVGGHFVAPIQEFDPFVNSDPLLTATNTATVTATYTAMATNTPTVTPTPTITPFVTVVLSTPVALPSGISTPNSATGGQVYALPTMSSNIAGVAIIQSNSNAPFAMSLRVPAPRAGATPIGIRVQPSTALDEVITPPAGSTIAKVLAIDVYDSATGGLIHDHPRPLEVTIQLTSSEMALCATDPGRIALLHIDANRRVIRLAPSNTNYCSTGVIRTLLTRTSSIAVAQLLNAIDIVFLRVILPIGLLRSSGW